MTTVSVVMCTFNGERFVGEQLQSVLAQTLVPVEILIADDGSSDGTLAIAEAVAATSAVPVLIRRNPVRLGFADNFLTACEVAIGDLIAFCDQDDVWLPGKLAEQVEALERTGAAMSAHDVQQIDESGALHHHPRSRTAPSERVVHDGSMDPWGNYLGNTLVFRRGLLGHIPAPARGGDPFVLGAPLSHDRWLYFLAGAYGGVVLLPGRLSRYRRHGHQLFGTEVPRSVRSRMQSKRADGHAQAVALASIARERAALLERHDGPQRSIRRWQVVAVRFDRSAAMWGRRLPVRVVQLTVSTLHGDYAPVRWGGLGLQRFLQDAAVALLIGSETGRMR